MDPATKTKKWIKDEIFYGPKHAGGLDVIKVDEFIHGLKCSWIHRYAKKGYNDHWCDLLDSKLNLDKRHRKAYFLSWGSAKWSHLIKEDIPFISSYLESFKLFTDNFAQPVCKTDNRWLYQPLFYNPNLSVGKKEFMSPQDYGIKESVLTDTIKVIDVYDDQGAIKSRDELDLSGLVLSRSNFMADMRFRLDLKHNIGPGKKYQQRPVPKIIKYSGNKPTFMAETIHEYFDGISKGSNKFREIISRDRRNAQINESVRMQIKLGVGYIHNRVCKQALKNMYSKIIPNEDKDYKLRALLGKTQFNNNLKHWIRDIDGICSYCTEIEDFKHATYYCRRAFNLYHYIFDNIKIGAKIDITNMVLSHERPTGAKEEEILKFELIDMISTIALKWILASRIKQIELNYAKCLIAIKNQLRNTVKSQPKYGTMIRGLSLNFDTG